MLKKKTKVMNDILGQKNTEAGGTDETPPERPAPHAQTTIDAVLAVIETGGWRPGQLLPSQRQLAERIGVSRPTVREALVALETMGLIRISPGRGIFLLRHAPREASSANSEAARLDASAQISSRLVQMYQFRYVVEPVVAGLAAQNITSAQLEDLKQLIERMREAIANKDTPLWARLNCAFHQQVIEAANNPFFTKALDPTLVPQIENQHPDAMALSEVVAEHEAVVGALQTRASGKARHAMRHHIGAAAARAGIELKFVQ